MNHRLTAIYSLISLITFAHSQKIIEGTTLPSDTSHQESDFSNFTLFDRSIIEQQPSIRSGNKNIIDTLTSFLTASTLEERRSTMNKSKLSDAELLKSVLNGSIPEIQDISLANRIDNPKDNRIEYFFSVTFDSFQAKKAGYSPKIFIQVSDFGESAQPLVHTDAFLDLFTRSKIDNFLKKSSGEELLVIHAIVESFRYNFNTDIPNHKETGFLKIRTHPDAPSLFSAYFSVNSELYRAISHPLALPWATPGIATVTVGWDRTNPKKPFVKLLKVNGYSWDL